MNPVGRIAVELAFLTSEEGGRATAPPPWGEYSPSVVVEGQSDYLGVRFVAGPRAGPGEAWPFQLDLTDPSVDYSSLQPGTLITIREGLRVVARGHVIRRLPILPESVTRVAYHSRNGEMAWRKQDLPAVLAVIADSGQAVLGVELWLAQGDGLWDCIPWIYDTAPRTEGESWPTFCRRTADEMAQEVGGWRLEELTILPEERDRVYFNLTYVTEAEGAT